MLSLDAALNHLVTAQDALTGWYAHGDSYVGDGHETIHSIDQLLRELHRVRAGLISEIRVDDDERAVRVDRLLANARLTFSPTDSPACYAAGDVEQEAGR